MSNVMNRVTFRYMKENKKRTIVTIIGVVLSVALITAVTTFGSSFLDLIQREIIETTGEWHSEFLSVPIDKVDTIKSNENIKDTFISTKIGDTIFKDEKYSNKIEVKSYDKVGFSKMRISAENGRLPQNSSEIVIEDSLTSYDSFPYKVGDEIKIDVGEFDQSTLTSSDFSNAKILNLTTKTYKIVGTVKNRDYTNQVLYSLIDDNLKISTVNVFVNYKNINKSIYDIQANIAQDLNVNAEIHQSLMISYGIDKSVNVMSTLYMFVGGVILIIMFSAVLIIRNAFYISIRERQKYLGVLSSVGASNKQKRRSIYVEAFFIAIIGIPIGLLVGIGGMAATFSIINPMLQDMFGTLLLFKVKISYAFVLMAIIASFLTIFISAIIPAIKSSRMSPISSIKQTSDFKIKKRKIKTSKITKMLFGFSGQLSMKNIKRSPKSYRNIVFSLATSIVLFLTMIFVVDQISQTVKMYSDKTLDIDVSYHSEETYNKNNENIIRGLINLNDVEKGEIVQSINSTIDLPLTMYSDEYRAIYKSGDDSSTKRSSMIFSLDDKSLEAFAKSAGTTLEKMKNKNICIVPNEMNVYSNKDNNKKFTKTQIFSKNIIGKDLEFGYTKSIKNNIGEYTEEKHSMNLNAIGTTDEKLILDPPFAYESVVPLQTIKVIVSEDTLKRISEKFNHPINSVSANLKIHDKTKSNEVIDNIKEIVKDIPGANVTDYVKETKSLSDIVFIISIFGFGFITLIVLVSFTNIINTISTSVNLRRKEFAMLKSFGMSDKGFNKMIYFESLFYGIKALLWGLLISFVLMYFLNKILSKIFIFGFQIPWVYVGITCLVLFVITGSTMLYAASKIKKQNIIDGLREENI